MKKRKWPKRVKTTAFRSPSGGLGCTVVPEEVVPHDMADGPVVIISAAELRALDAVARAARRFAECWGQCVMPYRCRASLTKALEKLL